MYKYAFHQPFGNFERIDFALWVNEAHVHFPCMQVGATIKYALVILESHGCLFFPIGCIMQYK
jgi:hypothetical protein